MKRRGVELEPVCHWCREPIPMVGYARALPSPGVWPGLPSGVLVAVCGLDCPERPEEASNDGS